jgi:uncharacterized protein
VSRPLESRKFVIAGGSGFLGVSLAHFLVDRGASVVILSRRPPKVSGPWRHSLWDGRTLGDWKEEQHGACGLVNLAGRSVICIKTPDHQDEILRSRVESTRVLGQALRITDAPPPVWVQMSTAHIYGDPPSVVCTEESALGYGLAPTVARTVWQVTSRIKESGTTVLMVEQNAGALPYADRALIMEKGTLVYTGVGDEIRGVNLREAYLGV